MLHVHHRLAHRGRRGKETDYRRFRGISTEATIFLHEAAQVEHENPTGVPVTGRNSGSSKPGAQLHFGLKDAKHVYARNSNTAPQLRPDRRQRLEAGFAQAAVGWAHGFWATFTKMALMKNRMYTDT